MATSNGNRPYSRYYCPNNDAHRVYPYDTFEAGTVAPKAGKKGDPILLFSLNAKGELDEQNRKRKTAWCWSCNAWVDAFQRTYGEILLAYYRREGVTFRVPRLRSEKQEVAALEGIIERKRGVAV